MAGQAGTDHVRLPPLHYWIVVGSVLAASAIQYLDMTIANVAIPHMQASLNAAGDTITWVLTSFIVASAVAIPLSGWVTARLGTRRLFLFSLIGFTATSMLCGLATNLFEMVLFRALQGLSSAFISTVAQTIVMNITPRERQSHALSMWGMTAMLGPIIGPTLGGYLTDNFNWRWVFFINAPIGIPAILLLLKYLPDSRATARRFDLFGYVALAAGLVGLQLMLDRGPINDWFDSAETVLECALALCAFAAFAIHARFADNLVFPRSLMTSRTVLLSMALSFAMSSVTLGLMALLPTMFQQVYGYPVMKAGELMAPRGIGIFITMYFIPRILQHLSLRTVLSAGFGIVTITLYVMTHWTLSMPTWEFAVTSFVQGLGMGFLMVPINMIGFSSVPMGLRTDCASLLNTVRSIGSSVAISASIIMFTRTTQSAHAELAAGIVARNVATGPEILRPILTGNPLAISALDAEVTRQAMMIGYLHVFFALLVLSFAAVGLGMTVRGKAQSS